MREGYQHCEKHKVWWNANEAEICPLCNFPKKSARENSNHSGKVLKKDYKIKTKLLGGK
jgi:hypothetical protein